MKYYLFLDESGDHGLLNPLPAFPIFLLCGVLISADNYELIRQSINELKESVWGTKNVIFHSSDIRKCQKEFQLFFNIEVKNNFYEKLNSLISNTDFSIIASAIEKLKLIQESKKINEDVYEIALSIVIEQTITLINQIGDNVELVIVIECRGLKEDKRLNKYFQQLLHNGTAKLTTTEISQVSPSFTFRNKSENINGLQLADLIAYPLARYVLDPGKPNPAFNIVESKILRTNGFLTGLKIYP